MDAPGTATDTAAPSAQDARTIAASPAEAAAIQAVRDAIQSRRPELLAELRRRAGGRVDPEEVLHAALQRALARAHQLRDPGRAAAWVARVARNALLDELRRRPEPVTAVEELELAPIEEDRPDGEDPDCGCVLVQAERLKPEYARILRRVIVDGARVTDVAAELGVTPNNAMVRLHRARAALRERLLDHCGTTSVRGCADCGCEQRGCCPPDSALESHPSG